MKTPFLAGVLATLGLLAIPRPAPADEPAKTEFGIVPLVGGDTDYGIGVGELSSVARLDPKVKPYRWRLESAAFITFKLSSEGSKHVISPYQDIYVLWTIPHFLRDRLRLDLRPSFTRETSQRYFGLGNDSRAPQTDLPSRDQYGRAHPTMMGRLRVALIGHFLWEFGLAYTENWFDLHPNSTLAMEMRDGTPTQRALLGTAKQHGVLLVENSLIYDSRENDVSNYYGQFHQLKLRLSPRLGDHDPYQYAQVNLTNRLYFLMAGPAFRLDLRSVIDMQMGDVPFYEMARYEDTFAFGGGNGVRGIPGQRYYGRVKAFGNIEVRSRLFEFQIHGKNYTLGSVVFFDFGRLWSEFARHPELDGTSVGLKYGVGGGLRFQQGQTFVVRADVAWSPDARPIGAYVAAGQAF